MLIFPAIDIKDGMCVRLKRGEYATAHKVAEDALQTARRFQKEGARWLHMVDLDGAKAGHPVNAQLIKRVTQNTDLKVEIGGGIRTMKTIAEYLEGGIARVILGSSALQDPLFTKQALHTYADRIAIGIDARDGMVAAEGWQKTSAVFYLEFAKQMEQMGAKVLIFTDISRDGMLSGPNLEMLQQLQQAVSCKIVASGGIRHAADIRALRAQKLYGAICGKSLYAGTLSVSEAQKAAEEELNA